MLKKTKVHTAKSMNEMQQHFLVSFSKFMKRHRPYCSVTKWGGASLPDANMATPDDKYSYRKANFPNTEKILNLALCSITL